MSLHQLLTGEKIMDFPMDLGTITGISGKKDHKEMFYSFCSFLTPNIIYRVDFSEKQLVPKVSNSLSEIHIRIPLCLKVIHETLVGDFNPSKYESKQVFYESKDGTLVPMFIIHKKVIYLKLYL